MKSTEIQKKLEEAKLQLEAAEMDDEKEFAQKKITKLEGQLEKALEKEAEEAKEEEANQEAEKAKKEKEEQEAANQKEEAEKLAKRKPKNPVSLTKDNLDDCKKSIESQGFRIQKISERIHSEKPKTERKVSTILADSFIRTISGAVNKELTLEKVVFINVAKLKEAGTHMMNALKCLRAALGGIDDDNSQMLNTFRKNFNDIVETVEEKQKEAEHQKAA